MEERNHENAMQFPQLAINLIANDASRLVGVHDANQYYVNEIHQASVPVTQWTHRQQIPQSYIEFLAESGNTEILNEMSCNNTAQVSSLGIVDPSQVKAFQAYTRSGDAALKCTSQAHQKRSREKAYAADRNRRLRISIWLEALQELLPQLKEGNKEALLDGVIDHVKSLKYQVMDLCRSRLGGESASNSFVFLEGQGHYLIHEQMVNKPLEEMMGKLLEVNPSAATELLQSRGLTVMPMTFAEGLHEPVQMLGMQGIKKLDRILEGDFPAKTLRLL